MQTSPTSIDPPAHPLWTWGKVGIVLVLLDVVVFRLGLFWLITPDFGGDLAAAVWGQVYTNARSVERERPSNAVLLVGSSVVGVGVHPSLLSASLMAEHVPTDVVKLSTFGATCTDSALMTWAATRLRPWLVIYGVIPRDFIKASYSQTPVFRTFYDSSVTLQLTPPVDTSTWLDGEVRRWWELYRYRFFARGAIRALVSGALSKLPPSASADDEPVAQLSPLEGERFAVGRVTPQAYAAWSDWRKTRRFSDYLIPATRRGWEVGAPSVRG